MGVSRSVKLKANDGLVYQFTNEKLSASSEGVQTFNHTTHAYNLVKMFEHLYIGIASRDLLAVVDLVDSRLSSRARLQPESHKSEVLQFLGTALQRGILHCRAIPETKPVIIHTELPSVPLIVSSGTTLPKGGSEAPITPSEDQIRVDTPAVAIKETEFCGDPVSMVSGEEILMIDDVALSGAQPITWGRMYRSGQCQFDVGMGYGWRSQYQYEFVLLEPEDQPEIWRFIDNEGCILYFDVIAKGAVSYQLRAGASLYHHPKGYYLLRLSDGRQLRFSWRYEGWRLDKLRIDQTTQYGFRYSSAGRMIGIETNGFLRLVLRYDASGHLVTVEMPSKEDDSIVNVIASYHYNADGQLVAATNRNKQTERYQYRDDHLLTCRQRASGFSHYFEWLGSGSTAKCRAQWGDNHCYQYQFDYDNSASSTISTDSRGHQWHYYHNEQGLLVKKISPAGAAWRYEYNQLGLKVAGIDPNGSITRYDYNAQGLLCALHAPSGAITRYCYNRFGQLTEQCSALGHITTHRFNSLGLLLETRHPEGNKDHYEYDHQGRLIKHLAAGGQCYGYWWNAEGLLTAFKQNHAVTRYSYDVYGEINGLANPDGSIIEYQRDSAGNIAQTRHYHPDHETPAVEQSYTYDDAGRLISHTDPIGRMSQIVWGGLSQPETIIQPDGSYVAYQYDQERNLTGITRSDGCHYQLEWDAEERVSRTIGFDGRDQHYAYDANSQLMTVREGDRTVHLVRDTAGRVIEKQTVAESGTRDSQLYDYDVIGRLLNANTTARKLRFEWQGSKQLNTTWQDAWQLQYEYDQQGNRTQLILPDGLRLGYQYDEQQQLSAITLNGADVLKVKRDKLGRELKRQQANGITQHCDFDSHGRLQQQKWTSEHDSRHRRQYHYDSASQLIAIQDNALGRQQFSYDALNQLQEHHQNNTTTNYQFDSFGNPSLGNLDFEECESTNDRLQRYQSKLFDYDKCGNQSTVRDEDSAQHRQFNGFNQLTQLSHNGRYSHYDYDALGRRSRKTTEQHTVDFLWDGDQLIGEHCQGQYRWYIYAPNDFTPLALIDNGALYFYHTDHIGTPHTVTDSEGEVVWQATYNALGCAAISIDIIHNPLRFQGQYHDQESGLHYNRFRYYDPSIGQFIHQDPIGLLGGINHYRYAPNPIQWVDPLGLSCKEAAFEKIKQSFVNHILADFDLCRGGGRVPVNFGGWSNEEVTGIPSALFNNIGSEKYTDILYKTVGESSWNVSGFKNWKFSPSPLAGGVPGSFTDARGAPAAGVDLVGEAYWYEFSEREVQKIKVDIDINKYNKTSKWKDENGKVKTEMSNCISYSIQSEEIGDILIENSQESGKIGDIKMPLPSPSFNFK
ncbi:RHS repeat-associated core domain-containing protein [Photobacterium profundum]|uniref:Hypothetical nucleotidyltransferase n=1 Tax=Photobacterium profundum (strain SS9) TaxID=298386 RepID=Q6LUC6_PHOPR|nr:RHS repeat-associated core domain-containing protein [Photobacterium profundum]CAG19099.1 hypothetical nucleotidyltransferase [Photobacterium profundum SS9]